jgi:FtsZ-binding cell division protein ZapB
MATLINTSPSAVMLAMRAREVLTQEGPDPATQCFLNFDEDRYEFERMGAFESIDMFTGHEKLLLTTLSDDHIHNLAVESIGDVFKNMVDWASEHPILTTIGGVALFAGSIYVTTSIRERYVPARGTMDVILDTYKELVKVETEACAMIPKDLNMHKWEDFYMYMGREVNILKTATGRLKQQVANIKTVKFEESGWTPDNFSVYIDEFVKTYNGLSEATREARNTAKTLIAIRELAKRADRLSTEVDELEQKNSNLRDKNARLERENQELRDRLYKPVTGFRGAVRPGSTEPEDVIFYITETMGEMSKIISASASVARQIVHWNDRMSKNFKRVAK